MNTKEWVDSGIKAGETKGGITNQGTGDLVDHGAVDAIERGSI